MTRHRRARWSVITVAMAAVVMLLAAPAAQASPAIPRITVREPQKAPLNPVFVLWQARSSLEPVLLAASPHGLGLRPAPTITYDSATSPTGAVGAYAATYDLRTLGKLPAVRNQNPLGTCWTFGSTGSLESSSLPGETLDLSEDNMALTSGFDVGGASTAAEKYDAGGNADMATAYLVRWSGPVYETDDAYGDGTTPGGLTARRHVENVDVWAGRASPSDNDRIKYAVSTYGGADISMFWADASYNATTKSYYYTGTDHPNHDVMVVGWDDTYAASNFTPAAAGPGAFIVRNSWGAAWGAGGYFYVSYHDSRFGRSYTASSVTYPNNVYTFEAAQPTTDYGAVYQYDPLGNVGTLGYGTAGTAVWGANVYTATAASVLNAVGFYTNGVNTAYEIWGGTSLTSLTRLTTGTMAQMGYHTVPLPAGTTMAGGATFVVAVKLSTPGEGWPMSYEGPYPGYSDAASAAAGQSYIGSNGTAWTDLTTANGFSNCNVCLKAYTSAIPVSSSAYSFSANATSGWKTAAQTVTVSATGGNGTGRTIYYSQDGGATWNTSAAASVNVSVSTEGPHDFKYYCADSLATETTHSPGYVNVDTVNPSTTDNHASVTLTAPCTVTLTPSDATSGVAKTEYKIDAAASYTTGTSVALTAGTHTVYYRSTDVAGNVEVDKSFTVTVAGVTPISTTTYSNFAANATTGWSTSGQTVHLTASGGSGTGRTIHYSQDGGATWSTAVADAVDVAVSTQGSHHIQYYASDSLATETTHDPGWVNVDSITPGTTDDHLTASLVAPATITLSPTDATSGMTGGLAKTEYKVDAAAAYSTGTSVVLTAGTHTVTYRSTDKAGNRESPDKSFTVTVTAPPIPTSACAYVFSPDAITGWKNVAQQFTITVDGGGGSGRTIHYSLDGGATWSTSTATRVDVPVTTDGAHHVQFYADDSLAGETIHDAGWINIDTGKPWTTAAKASVRKGAKVALKYRANDVPGGCGKAVLKLQIRMKTRVVKTIALGSKATNMALSYKYTAKLKAGTYTWRVLATDLAGNVAAKMTAGRLVIR